MRRWLAAAVIIVGGGGISAYAAGDPGAKTEAFFNGLACRNAQILGGQNDIGAIFYHHPIYDHPREGSARLKRTYTVSEEVQPLGVFRILPPDAKRRPRSRIRTVFSTNAGVLATLDHIGRGSETRLYWSPTDDLVIWNMTDLLLVEGRAVRSGLPFLLERVNAPALQSMLTDGRQHVVPEHFSHVARRVVWGSGHRVAEFDPRTRSVQRFREDWGLFVILGADQIASTESDVFVRLTKINSTYPTHLEIFRDGDEIGGRPFAPMTFPYNAKLLLIRDYGPQKIPEAVLLWRDWQSKSHVATVRLGSPAPKIVAEDYMRKVFLSPDRTKIYGYSDYASRFHPIPNEQHSSEVLFWLEQLKAMDGVEEFYLLDRARYAVVKRNGRTTGPEAIVLERQGSTAVRVDHLCRTDSPVERIVEGPASLLFIPKERAGNNLVVYLHDGPFATIGRGSDWITDVVARIGAPVLTINYFGSSSRTRELAVARDIAPMFAKDVADAVEFARTQLAEKDPKITFLAHGFGTFVGFSAMMAEAVWPEHFVILSGITDARRIFSDHVPDRDPVELNYLSRAGRQLNSVMNPAAASQRGTQFLFVHGNDDNTMPYADVARLVAQLNAQSREAVATMTTVDGMGHLPQTKKEYEAVIEAIDGFIH